MPSIPGSTSIYLPGPLAERVRDIARRERRPIVTVIEQMVDLYESPTMLVRTGLCPSCRRNARMQFLGIQDGYDGSAPLTLWQCGGCRTTVCGNQFLPPDDEIDLVRRYAAGQYVEPA